MLAAKPTVPPPSMAWAWMLTKMPRIVVVEDDASMRRAIERNLRVGGYSAVMLDSAEAALAGEELTLADCLVLDVHLPGLSGFELHERLALSGQVTPTIFITGHDEPASRDRAKQLGARKYLAKPFSGRALLDAVAQALETA